MTLSICLHVTLFMILYSFPLEVHLVHKRVTFDTLGEAVADPKGLVVLGFMYNRGGRSDFFNMIEGKS